VSIFTESTISTAPLRMKQVGPVGTQRFPFNFNFQAPADFFKFKLQLSKDGDVSGNQTILVIVRVFCHSVFLAFFHNYLFL
jgi:hypothetical protein